MGDNSRNDCSDAFRHTFFNAINTVSCGPLWAQKFGDAHECVVPSNEASEKEMDLYNNSVGVTIGQAFGKDEQAIIDEVCLRLKNGALLILSNPSNPLFEVINSDGCECTN